MASYLDSVSSAPLKETSPLARVLLRPEVRLAELVHPDGLFSEVDFDSDALATVEMDLKYAGYIARDLERAEALEQRGEMPLRVDLPYESFESLSFEAREKLAAVQPETLGQASRIPGVSPADVQNLLVEIKKNADRAKVGA